jgi:hypothetical protein
MTVSAMGDLLRSSGFRVQIRYRFRPRVDWDSNTDGRVKSLVFTTKDPKSTKGQKNISYF